MNRAKDSSQIRASEKDGQISEGIMRMLREDAPEPAPTVEMREAGVFDGRRIEPQPASFEFDRAKLRYVASDDNPRGDLLIGPDGVEIGMSPRAVSAFCRVAGLKHPQWFLRTFDAPTRSDMAAQTLAAGGSRIMRFFYRDTPEGPLLMNIVDAKRPILSDADALTVAAQVLGGDARIFDMRSYAGGIVVKLRTRPEVDVAKKKDAQVGDLIAFGVQLRNSQVGFYPLEVDGFVERLVCRNGMTTSDRIDAWSEYDRDRSLTVADLVDWFRKALADVESKIDERLARARSAVETEVPGQFLAEVIANYSLGATVLKEVYAAYMTEPGTTLWHYANAITRAAHTGPFDYEMQLRMEKIGGELVFG